MQNYTKKNQLTQYVLLTFIFRFEQKNLFIMYGMCQYLINGFHTKCDSYYRLISIFPFHSIPFIYIFLFLFLLPVRFLALREKQKQKQMRMVAKFQTIRIFQWIFNGQIEFG